MKRHILLVGLPGSGKTTVGRLVAQQLGAAFVDVDTRIAARAGRSIPEIFAEQGEAVFRALEAEEMTRALAQEPAVLAPGGGWAAQPRHLDHVTETALVVYLATDPEEAARRVAPEGDRPLVNGADPVSSMRQLLAVRQGAYAQAAVVVRTDGRSPAAVARDVVRLARNRGGW